MSESARRTTLADAALCTALCAAVAAVAISRRTPAIGLLALPCVFGLFVRLPALAPALHAGAERVLWGTLALLVLFGAAWAIYPVLPESAVRAIPLAAGSVLVVLGAVGLSARAVWPPGRGALPATLGILVVACFDAGVPVGAPVAAAAAGLLLHVGLEGRRPSALRLGVFGLGAAGVAVAVAALLPWAQPQVEQAVADLTNPTSAVTSGAFSSTSRLGDVEDLALSTQLVLRMWSASPRKLRARVFTTFDGTTWRGSKGGSVTRLVPATPPLGLEGWLASLPGRSFARTGGTLAARGAPTKVILAGAARGALFAPARPVLVRLAGEPPRLARGGVLVPDDPVRIYGVVSLEAGEGEDEGPSEEALAVPADTDARIRRLATALAGEAPAAEARIARTVADLGGRCRYALHVGRFRTRQPVAEFLFEKKQGYCEYFASAAAVLLRLQGVPTRYVTGFSVQDGDWQGDHYVVRESGAHAWLDAFVAGRGWVEVDPTPAAQFAALHPPLAQGAFAAAWERLQAAWAEIAARLGSGDYAAAVRPLAGLVLAGLGLAAWRRRKSRAGRAAATVGPALPPEVRDLLGRVDALASRRGFPRPAWRAPLEHLATLPAGALPELLREAARDVVLACYRARFGERPLAAAEADALRARLAGASRPAATAR